MWWVRSWGCFYFLIRAARNHQMGCNLQCKREYIFYLFHSQLLWHHTLLIIQCQGIKRMKMKVCYRCLTLLCWEKTHLHKAFKIYVEKYWGKVINPDVAYPILTADICHQRHQRCWRTFFKPAYNFLQGTREELCWVKFPEIVQCLLI